MATYIPSNQAQTTQALTQWGQGQRATQNLNMRTAQQQMNNLLQLGVAHDDPRIQKSLGTMMAGGNPFAMLSGAKSQIKPLQSSLQQTGDTEEREYGGIKKLATEKSKNSLIVGQEMLERLRKEKDDKILTQIELNDVAAEDRQSAGLGTNLMGLASDDIKASEEIDKEIKRIDSNIEGLGTQAKKDIKVLRESGVNISKEQEDKLTQKELSSQQSRRIIGGGTTQEQKDKIFGGVQENVKKFEKEQDDFMAAEKKRISEVRKTGGPLSGTETQMREKTRLDFKQLMNGARSAQDMRQKYNDYVTTMHNIDDRYKRKRGYYPPFEKAYGSLFRASKGRGSGGRRGSGSTGYEVVHYVNKDGNPVKLRINASSEQDAVNKLRNKNINIKTDDLYFTKFGKNVDAQWMKTRRESFLLNKGQKMKLDSALNNLDKGIKINLADGVLDKVVNSPSMGIKNKTALVDALDSGDGKKMIEGLTTDQRREVIKYVDTLGTKEKMTAFLGKNPVDAASIASNYFRPKTPEELKRQKRQEIIANTKGNGGSQGNKSLNLNNVRAGN